MASSTLITDYMAEGTHAARPATPNVPAGGSAIYYETDTTNTFAWSGAAWVQINGGAPSVVQSAASAGASISGVTFGAAPTNGNLLVAIIISNNSPGVGTGWTNFFPLDGSGLFFSNVFVKIAGAGESTTQTPVSAANNMAMVIFECANAIPGPPKYHASSSGTTNLIAADAFGTGEIILGACCNESTAALPTGFTGATAGVTAAGTASSIAAFTKAAPTKGLAANNITATYAVGTATKTASISIGLA